MDYSTWLTKQQAADVIGVSTKFIEKLTQEKRLQMFMYRRPEGGPRIAVYHPADVERERAQRNPNAFVVARTTSDVAVSQASVPEIVYPASDHAPVAEISDASRIISEHSQKPLLPPSELMCKVYLTIGEAQALSGLPVGAIRQAVRDNLVKMIGTRYRRCDLERL